MGEQVEGFASPSTTSPAREQDKAAGVSVCVQEVHIAIITCSLAVTLGKEK